MAAAFARVQFRLDPFKPDRKKFWQSPAPTDIGKLRKVAQMTNEDSSENVLLGDDDWDLLVQSIRDRECVLVLGPTASAHPDDPNGLPLSVSLARQLANSLSQSTKPQSTNSSNPLEEQIKATDDLGAIAELYLHRCEPNSSAKLRRRVKDFYRPLQNLTTPLHRDLAQMRFPLCINATHDHFLINALREDTTCKCHEDDYDYTNQNPGLRREAFPANGDVTVYNLFGSIDGINSMVLSETDLLKFLVNVTKNTPEVDAYVIDRLRECGSILFLGFEFHRWYARILWHVLSSERDKRDIPLFAGRDQRFRNEATGAFFQLNEKLTFFDWSPPAFVAELKKRLGTLGHDTPPPKPLTVSNRPDDRRPTVFICHKSEDKPAVRRITDFLNSRQIDVWMDERSLRGGDRWENAIETVISNAANYFLLLASPRLMEGRSYCFKEIGQALDVRSQYRPDWLFIIPTILDLPPTTNSSDFLHSVNPFLREMHAISLDSQALTTSESAAKLEHIAQIIHEDWAKPNRRPK